MADRRRLSYWLASTGGALVLVWAAFFSNLSEAVRLRGGDVAIPVYGWFLMAMPFVVALAGGVALLVAAPRLRSPDDAVRKRWAIVALVGAGVCSIGPAWYGGALGIAAGALTLHELERPAPSAPAP